MQYYKLVPLKKVLNNSLGKDKASRYLQGVDANLNMESNYSNTTNIYQDALTHLYNGDMDIAINYVIYGLDAERNNKLLFNLCKNMTFLLSKHLADNNAEIFRQKYNPSLEKAVVILKNKTVELEKNLEFENSNYANMEIELEKSKPKSFFTFTKPYTLYLLKKRKLKSSLNVSKTNTNEYQKKFNVFNDDLEEIEGFVQVEEDVRVLGIIMEVCILPSKYEWLMNKPEIKAENVS